MSDTPQDFSQMLNQHRGGWNEAMGLRFLRASADEVVAELDVARVHQQPYGIVHGGVHCSVVETLGSIGGMLWLGGRDPDGKVVGVNNSTDFYRAVRDGAMTSTATPIHQGRSQQVWLIETYADGDDRLVARGQLRLQNLYP